MITKCDAASVWRAVIEGNTTCAQVSHALNVSRSQTATYLRVMAEVGLLHLTVETTYHRHGVAQTYFYKPNYDAAQALGW
jgi:predicted transcriptional regulator